MLPGIRSSKLKAVSMKIIELNLAKLLRAMIGPYLSNSDGKPNEQEQRLARKQDAN